MRQQEYWLPHDKVQSSYISKKNYEVLFDLAYERQVELVVEIVNGLSYSPELIYKNLPFIDYCGFYMYNKNKDVEKYTANNNFWYTSKTNHDRVGRDIAILDDEYSSIVYTRAFAKNPKPFIKKVPYQSYKPGIISFFNYMLSLDSTEFVLISNCYFHEDMKYDILLEPTEGEDSPSIIIYGNAHREKKTW